MFLSRSGTSNSELLLQDYTGGRLDFFSQISANGMNQWPPYPEKKVQPARHHAIGKIALGGKELREDSWKCCQDLRA